MLDHKFQLKLYLLILNLIENAMQKTCTFNVPGLCNYTISCSGGLKYIWKRHNGTTPTFGTGPDMDFSETKDGKFSMYPICIFK